MLQKKSMRLKFIYIESTITSLMSCMLQKKSTRLKFIYTESTIKHVLKKYKFLVLFPKKKLRIVDLLIKVDIYALSDRVNDQLFDSNFFLLGKPV